MQKIIDRLQKRKVVNLLQEFSIPLIAGVLFGVVWANLDESSYRHVIDWPLFGEGFKLLGHSITFHFLVNDIFMVFFFGIATVEIVQALRPGGQLNPVRNAFNPLIGALGGVFVPIVLFFLFAALFPLQHLVSDAVSMADIRRGWGIPTATDIALAWLVARLVFGYHHPAVSYLLLLAIIDDAIGLGIIAIFYPDPQHPVQLGYLSITLLGIFGAWGLRRLKVKQMIFYVVLGGGLAWLGLLKAYLHPALALVFIVPFMPAGDKNKRTEDMLFEEDKGEDSTLHSFEHFFKFIVDFGLFGFGLANAGVAFSQVNNITWIVILSLVLGKIVGISLLGGLAHMVGIRLPEKIGFKELLLIGLIAGLGLTVALFVAGEAYPNPTLQNAAKMGAFLSLFVGFVAFALGKILRVKKIK